MISSSTHNLSPAASTLAGAAFGLIGAVALYRHLVHNRVTLPKAEGPGQKKRILITGGASGIGLATAKLLKAEGWIVGIADINFDACEKARAQIQADGAYKLNVVDVGECNKTCEEFVKAFGGMDVLFNSAGILSIGMFMEEPIEKQTKQIRINFEGVCNMTYAAVKQMQRGSRVVTMASGSAVFGIPNHAVYAATKAAVYHFTEGLNMELYPKGISVCDVSVMYVASPMVSAQANKNTLILQRQELFIQPETVAKTVYDAIMQARLHREHFYVGYDLAATFKFVAFCRAFGLRLAAKAVYFTNVRLILFLACSFLFFD